MKTLIIGLDGGTWDVFAPLCDLGEMPNLAKLRAGGAWGVLKAPQPPTVAASWATMATGVNPGRHGLLTRHAAGADRIAGLGYGAPAITGADVHAPMLWQYFHAHDLTTGTINVPLSYPLRPGHGFAISGMFTPPRARNWLTPADLKNKLQDYVIDLDYGRAWQDGQDADNLPPLPVIMDDILHMTERRGMHILRLMRDLDWDVFTAVFTGTERIFRYFWHYLHAEDEDIARNLDGAIADKLYTFFDLLDQVLGAMVKMAGKDTRILLFSSYGYGPAARYQANLNNWLLELDLLRLKPSGASIEEIISTAALPMTDPAKRILNPEARKAVQRYGSLAEAIDRHATQAWAVPLDANIAGITLNRTSFSPPGPVHPDAAKRLLASITEQALSLCIPGRNEPLVTDILPREKLFHGPYVEQFPDIILTLHPDYAAAAQLGSTLLTPIHPARRWHSGQRRREGMLLASGPYIRRGQRIHPASLLDLAPTLLYLANTPIPESMEGQVITGIFTPDYPISHPPVTGPDLPTS